MIAAFIFNPDHQSVSGYYGYKIKKLIIEANIIQDMESISTIRLGDILLPSSVYKSRESFDRVASEIFVGGSLFTYFDAEKLLLMMREKYLFCWVIENIKISEAVDLSELLRKYPSFLGSISLNWGNEFHLNIFRNLLSSKYRVYRKRCNILYSMGNEENADLEEISYMLSNGFQYSELEDDGARNTILDSYNNEAYFLKVNEFKNMISGLSENHDPDDIEVKISNLNPSLFLALGAAAKVTKVAVDKEDFAQAGLAIRRYLEQFADTLFPPRQETYNGKNVSEGKTKNQIWAYISDSTHDETTIQRLGKLFEEVIEDSSSVTHHKYSSQEGKYRSLILKTLNITSELLTINPEAANKPYYAFMGNINAMIRQMIAERPTILD